MRALRPFLAVAALCTLALLPTAAMAHGGETGIDVFPGQAQAGAEVTVFGEELEGDAVMELHLVTSDGMVLLAEPKTDDVGHFTQSVTLPASLTERVYEVRLTMPDGRTASAYVTVVAADPAAPATAPASDEGGAGPLVLAGVVALGAVALLAALVLPAGGARRAR
jgi:hypothetical protein